MSLSWHAKRALQPTLARDSIDGQQRTSRILHICSSWLWKKANLKRGITQLQRKALRLGASLIGQSLGIPVVSMSSAEAATHFGWLTAFVSKDMSASSTKTRALLRWEPVEQGLLADLEQIGEY